MLTKKEIITSIIKKTTIGVGKITMASAASNTIVAMGKKLNRKTNNPTVSKILYGGTLVLAWVAASTICIVVDVLFSDKEEEGDVHADQMYVEEDA